MVPVKDTFGEGWVEMDDNESHSRGNELASPETAIADASGCLGSEIKQEINIAHEIENNHILKEPSINHHVQNVCKSKEDSLLVEESLKVSGVDESKFKKFNLAALKQIHDSDAKGEQLMKNEDQVKSSRTAIDSGLRPCRAWLSGREKRNSHLKRVMSEKSFMQGQVMLSKNNCVKEVMRKRECNKAKEGDKCGDSHIDTSEGKSEDSEQNVGEMEQTMMYGSDMEQNGIVEGEEMQFLCIPPLSLRNHYMHTSAKESAVNPALSPLAMHPKSMASKATFKEVHMHQQALETIQHNRKKLSDTTDVVRTALACRALNGAAGMHLEKAEGSIETQSKPAGRAAKPLKPLGQLSKKAQATIIPSKENGGARGGRMDALEVMCIGGEAPLQREQGGGRMQANAGVLEVKEVECECCGMGEECTTGYVEHVKEMFSGHWVCGLCAEAVHEERHRLGKGVPMEEAVRAHMNVCKQFSSMKESGGPPHSPGVAHAVCNLLSRHLSSDPTSPRQVATTAARPILSRTSSCLPSLSHKPPCSS